MDTLAAAGEAPASALSLRLFLTARIVSILGSQITLVAIPWLVITSSGSAGKMGLIAALEMAVISLLSVPAGIVIDRVGARRYLLGSDIALAALIAFLCFAGSRGSLNFPLLALLTVLIAVPSAGYTAAASVALRQIVGSSPADLAKAGAESSIAYQIGSISGKALAGLIVAAFGVIHSMYLDVASFLASFAIFLIALPRPARTESIPTDSAEKDSWLSGATFLFRNRQLLRLVVGAAITAACFSGMGIAIPVALARNFVSPVWLGISMSALAVGAIAGSSICRKASSNRSPKSLLAIGIRCKLASALAILVIYFAPQASALPLFLLGVAGAFEGASLFAILGSEVPDAYLGRVLSATGAVATVLAPLSALGVGLLLDTTPLMLTVLLLVSLGIAGALVQIDRDASHEGAVQ